MSQFQKGLLIGIVVGVFVWPMVRGMLQGRASIATGKGE